MMPSMVAHTCNPKADKLRERAAISARTAWARFHIRRTCLKKQIKIEQNQMLIDMSSYHKHMKI